MKQINQISSLAFLCLGILCILFPARIADLLPFLLGGLMLFAGGTHIIVYLKSKRFLENMASGMGSDIILFVMGVVFLCARSNALGLMGVVWGIIGLRKAAGTIDQALTHIYLHRPSILLIVETLIRIILALALLFDPFEKFSPHIILLGLELILTNVKLPREDGDDAFRHS